MIKLPVHVSDDARPPLSFAKSKSDGQDQALSISDLRGQAAERPHRPAALDDGHAGESVQAGTSMTVSRGTWRRS